MAIVFARKLTKILADRSINKSALRNDSNYDGSIRPSVVYRLFDRNRAVSVTTDTIDRLCRQLNCQPGDIMEYIPNEDLEKMNLYYDPETVGK